MIQADFYVRDDGLLAGFSITGHAMFAPAGEDIVCAAVSSAAYMAANTITEVLCLTPEVSVSEGRMRVRMRDLKQAERAQTVLKGLQLHLVSVSATYMGTITVKLRGVKNA